MRVMVVATVLLAATLGLGTGAARAETGIDTADTADTADSGGDSGGDSGADTSAETGADDTGGHDTADAGERDTDPYVDEDAVTEEVYTQDVGCATVPGAGRAVRPVLLGLTLLAVAAWRRGGRRRK